MTETEKPKRRLRSQDWFDNPDHLDMTALYLERFMNYGVTPEELRSGKPVIGIAQSGSDLTPCNRVHVELVKRVRDGIRDAGGIPIEFPTHPMFENCKRPTAALDRNLAYLSLVEVLYGYPLDGVVLTTGCDKTTPSALMAASTVDIPAIVLSGGPMLDGYHDGDLVGSGTVIWRMRRKYGAGEITREEFLQAALAERFRHQHGVENDVGAPAFAIDRISRQGGKHGIPHRPFHQRRGQVLVDDGLRQPAQPGNVAAGGLHVSAQAAEQGGFAAAIGGDDADAVPGIYGEAKVGKKRLAQNDSEVSKRDDGHEVVSGRTDP